MIRFIANHLRNHLFERIIADKITVFLVGSATSNPKSKRNILRNHLIGTKYRTWFDVYYPEDIFEEILRNKRKLDLLTLENLLAESVNCIVIVLESPGSFTELGAFSNHSELSNKLVVLVDQKHKKDRSFINLGPLSFLRKRTESKVLFLDFEDWSETQFRNVRRSIRNIYKNYTTSLKASNIVDLSYFILTLLYVLGDCNKIGLQSAINTIWEGSNIFFNENFSSGLIICLSSGYIRLAENNRYCLTKVGKNRLKVVISKQNDSREIFNLLDALRVQVLNLTLRGKTKGLPIDLISRRSAG